LYFLLEPDSAFAVARPAPSDTCDKQERVEDQADDDGDEERGRSRELRIGQSGLRPWRGEEKRKEEIH
jgi:hypothetical protein